VEIAIAVGSRVKIANEIDNREKTIPDPLWKTAGAEFSTGGRESFRIRDG